MTRDGALYLGSTLSTTTHAAHAFKIYIAIHGEFDLLLAGSRWWSSLKSVVIAPDRSHKVIGSNAIIALIYLFPETLEGRKFSNYYHNLDIFFPPRDAVAASASRLNMIWEQGCWIEEASILLSTLYKSLIPALIVDVAFDPRIACVLEYISAELDGRMTIAEVASVVGLSPSRLEHLFSEQVRIPISRYLLWVRLRKALEMMSLGMSLTEVAYTVGFADSAHLSRTFRRMLGIAPSMMLKNINLHCADK